MRRPAQSSRLERFSTAVVGGVSSGYCPVMLEPAQPLKNASPPVPELTYEAQVKRAEARLGHRVGKWALERLLGVGGMAAVYAARHRNGDRVAIKMLHPELSSLDDVRTRFLTEGYAANRVGHPGVASVRDEGTADDGSVFLVMDLLQGETLDDLCYRRGGVLGVQHALQVAHQLLDILASAHGRGVIHRDIKPENVFITEEGKVKLLDFGVARLPDCSRATKVGAALGTPSFMAPEQARGHSDKMDARTDLWAVGATLYTLLTGKFVHDSDNLNEHLYRAMTEPVPSIRFSAQLPESVVALVDRALAFDPDERFHSAREMQGAIQGALAEVEQDESLVEPEPLSARVSGVVSKKTPQAFMPTERPPATPSDFEQAIELPVRKSRAGAFVAAALAMLALLALFLFIRQREEQAAVDVEPIRAAPKAVATQPPIKAPAPKRTESKTAPVKQTAAERLEAESEGESGAPRLAQAVSSQLFKPKPAKPSRPQATTPSTPEGTGQTASETDEASADPEAPEVLDESETAQGEAQPEAAFESPPPEPAPSIDPLSRRK